jgi:hypothetical protein
MMFHPSASIGAAFDIIRPEVEYERKLLGELTQSRRSVEISIVSWRSSQFYLIEGSPTTIPYIYSRPPYLKISRLSAGEYPSSAPKLSSPHSVPPDSQETHKGRQLGISNIPFDQKLILLIILISKYPPFSISQSHPNPEFCPRSLRKSAYTASRSIFDLNKSRGMLPGR